MQTYGKTPVDATLLPKNGLEQAITDFFQAFSADESDEIMLDMMESTLVHDEDANRAAVIGFYRSARNLIQALDQYKKGGELCKN